MSDQQVDNLASVFTPQALQPLIEASNPSPTVQERLAVLDVRVPPECDREFLAERRRAWNAYVSAAIKVGGMDGDLRGRLVSLSDKDFRGAMGECVAAWFLVVRLDLLVRPRPAGRPDRVLDFSVELGDNSFGVEVKSPYLPQFAPRGFAIWSDDRDVEALRACAGQAAKQFDECRNLLIIVASLSLPVTRMCLAKAFIATPKIAVPLALGGDPLRKLPDPRMAWDQDGLMAKLWGGELRHTRISAILCLDVGGMDWEKPRVHVVHHPAPRLPIDPSTFGEIPQFVFDGSEMTWTDEPRVAESENPRA